MNSLETNALRIAELMGWNPDSKDNNVYNIIIENRGHDEWLRQPHYAVIKTFSSYNGLMPIIFECMFQQDCFRGAIDDMCISIEKYYPEDDSYDNASFDFNLEKENPFIEAIQLACIKYLELRNVVTG